MLSGDEFLNRVESEVLLLRDSYVQDSMDASFAQWVLELLFPFLDSDQAFNLLTEPTDDTWNINAHFRDDENAVFFLVSAHYSNASRDTSLGPGIIYSLLDAFRMASGGTGDTMRLPSVLTEANLALREGYALSIILASLADFDASVDPNALAKKHGLNEQQFRYFDRAQLRRIYAGLEEYDETQSIILNLESNASHAGPVEAIVGNVTGRELTNALKDLVPRVYDVNLRAPLGTTKVNKQMRETLADEEERRFFWYYNNGITILCTRFEASSNDANIVTVYSPRIVNGAQTTDTILSARDEELEGVSIMVRLIEALPGANQVGDDLYMNIARYTNSQNPIETPDFRSNEAVQKQLHDKFADLGWFYESRRGQLEDAKK